MKIRTVQIKIVLTPNEVEKFDLVRGKVRRAVAARLIILGQPSPKPTDPAVAKLSFELNKIGTNLNQIARRFNEKYPDEPTFKQALRLVSELKASLSS